MANQWSNPSYDGFKTPSTQCRSASPYVRELFRLALEKRQTHKQLALALDICGLTIQRWYAGKTAPDAFQLEAFAKHLGYEFRPFRR